jgi:arylsulfatase A-like enzyme
MDQKEDKKQPNIIWFIVDQMRGQAMSHRGDPNVQTPNLDLLAAQGVTFPNALAGTPLCSPFRGSLVTGQYPHRSTVPGHDFPLAEDMPTIAHAFRAQGYRTCWIGKWHLDGKRPGMNMKLEENQPHRRKIPAERRGGFEDWWAYENNNRPFNCWIHTDRDGETVSYRLPGYETDCLTDIMIDWLKKQVNERANQPFFGVLSVQPPHVPYIAPAENMRNYNPAKLELRRNVPQVGWVLDRARRELAGYYAAIERIDWNMGRLRAALEELGLDNNTYIIFFSDHGDMLGSQGQFWKTNPWEEAIRIPFIVSGPDNSHQIYVDVQAPLNHVDIAPTTLGLCGIEKPPQMVGTDYSRYIFRWLPAWDVPLHDQSYLDFPDSAYLSLPVPTLHPDSTDRPWRGLVTRDGWKYVVLEGQPWLLYNLNDDPYEQVNLAHNTRFNRQRRILHERLSQWVQDTGDEFKLPNF